MIKTGTLTLLLVSVMFLSHSLGQENLVSFYPKAFAITQLPLEQSKLKIIYQEKVEEVYVTFLGIDKSKIILAAITDFKLKNPKKSINTRGSSMSKRSKEETMDWGYVFDRNRDGRIDYIAYLDGALPVKTKDVPANLPNVTGKITFEDLKIMIKNTRLVFYQGADDDFDGRVDGIVTKHVDSKSGWVEGWDAFRSSQSDGNFDQRWHFQVDIEVKASASDQSDHDTLSEGSEAGQPLLEPDYITGMTNLLSLLNRAAEQCKLTMESFER